MTDKVKIFGIIAIAFLILSAVMFLGAFILSEKRTECADKLLKIGLACFVMSLCVALAMTIAILVEA